MTVLDVGKTWIGLKPRWETVPGWKRKLLYAAATLGLIGLGFDGYEAFQVEEESTRTNEVASVEQGAAEKSTFNWGGPAGRLGWSFSLAFLAALAMRWFLKTALTLAGLAAAGAALLVHHEIIDSTQINDATEWARSLGLWLSEHTESAAAFLKGHLPSGAASGAGLFLGLRK